MTENRLEIWPSMCLRSSAQSPLNKISTFLLYYDECNGRYRTLPKSVPTDLNFAYSFYMM